MKLLKKSYISSAFFLIFLIKVLVLPEPQEAQITIGSSGTSGITCHLSVTDTSTQTLFEFTDPVKLRAEQNDFYFDGPRILTVPLLAGRYTVRLESHDVHIGFPPQFQDREWYYVRLLDGSNNVINNSGRTNDLTDSEDYRDDLVNDASNPLVLTSNALSITAVHPEYPQPPCPDCNAHSIYPVCALFEKLPEPTSIPTPTPSIDPSSLSASCPFTEDNSNPARVSRVIRFNNPATPASPFIRSDTILSEARSSPVVIDPPIPQGRYKVSLASYDHHIQDPDPAQTKERWFVDFYSGNTNNPVNWRGFSPPSNDLAETSNFRVDWHMEWLNLSQSANRAVATHYDYFDPSTPNSIIPVCALIEGPEPDPPPEERDVRVHVRDVTSSGLSGGQCLLNSGSPVSVPGFEATLFMGSRSSVQPINSGVASFDEWWIKQGYSYVVYLTNSSNMKVLDASVIPGPGGGSGSAAFFQLSSPVDYDVVFCVSSLSSWFRTDRGDVRFKSVNNRVPATQYGTIDNSGGNFPGIYFSSDSLSALFSPGEVSPQGWLVTNEYDYNEISSKKNGTLSYDFFMSKTRQEGIPRTTLTPSGNNLNWADITASGVYHVAGDLDITSDFPPNFFALGAKRIVLLVDGDVSIDTENLTIPDRQGLLVVASNGEITFEFDAENIDGYYSAREDIVIDGATCVVGNPDNRLTINGALVANANNPFSKSGSGAVENRRSLCVNDEFEPSLQVNARLDFLIQLTDFYKTTYTKWEEGRP